MVYYEHHCLFTETLPFEMIGGSRKRSHAESVAATGGEERQYSMPPVAPPLKKPVSLPTVLGQAKIPYYIYCLMALALCLISRISLKPLCSSDKYTVQYIIILHGSTVYLVLLQSSFLYKLE